MAYFECIIGGASGDGVSLIVECTSDFAGSIITADNGNDTFTETCPSTSPYTVKFESIPLGTYTISGIASGQTFSTQFTVIDYSTSLNAIPNGATITPIDDIQIWLHCANIWDKSYTAIAQVLADASTLQALIASNNAADYMARSTSWASDVTANSNAMTYIGANEYCATKLLSDSTWLNAIYNSTYFQSVLNVKIPTMTSATSPSGQVFAATQGSSDPAWRAFDNNANTIWWNGNQGGRTIGYKFTTQVNARKLQVRGYGVNNDAVKTFRLQGSNDNSNYTDIGSSFTLGQNNNLATFNISSNTGYYQYYRIYVDSNYGGTGYCISEIQLYGRALA